MQAFNLKYHGKFSFSEINMLTSEDRNWMIKQINKEQEKQNEANNTSAPASHPVLGDVS